MKRILLCMAFSCGFLGCGSTDGALNTSTVTATIDTHVLDSDVVSWVDAAGVKATACVATSFRTTPAADSVNLTFVSKAASAATTTGTTTTTAATGLSVRIESATINYTPANSATPAMASEYQAIGTTIASGGTVTLPIRVATHEQKALLQSTLECNGLTYKYYTNIILDITEVGTNKKTTVNTSLDLRFADFTDK